MKRLRILVCGTNYGRSYLQALRSAPRAYELVGILSRGSVRSIGIARANGVPHWKTVADLPTDVDLACVALPSTASRVVLELLDRKIPVLCEHPQPAHFLRLALKKALSNHTCFHLNAHFSELPAAQSFLQVSRRRLRGNMPAFLAIVVADRALYAALDLLRRCLGNLAAFREFTTETAGPFCMLRGSLSGVPTGFLIQDSRRFRRRLLHDADAAYLADLRICMFSFDGTLTLASVAGPVLWNANYARQGMHAGLLWKVMPQTGAMKATKLRRLRIEANRRAIGALVRSIRDGTTPPEQSAEHLLEVSRAWETLGRLLRS
jgi:pyochelin biosynthesis protein PchG